MDYPKTFKGSRIKIKIPIDPTKSDKKKRLDVVYNYSESYEQTLI